MGLRSAVVLVLWALSFSVAGKEAETPFHSPIESDVLAELNLARLDPRSFAGHLREMRRSFRDRFSFTEEGMNYLTQEGIAAVDEAIAFLEKARPVPALTGSLGLALAARDLVLDQALNGGTGHRGGDGSDPLQRLSRYVQLTPSHFLTQADRVAMAEVIAYGRDRPRAIVMTLIVDDGVPGRGHRLAIFDARFSRAGVAFGPHPLYGWACVVDLAGEFREGRRRPRAR